MCLDNRSLHYYIQWIATFGIFILTAHAGLGVGWAAPNIAKLTTNNSIISLNNDEVSWIVSLVPLGAVVGAPVGSVCIEFFGARRSLLMCFLFITVSWACIVIADSVIWLYAARFFSGIGMAAIYCCFAIYLGEIADPKIRGTLVSIAASGNPFGVVVGTITETYLPMKVSSAIYLIVSVFGLILFLWFRDSPYYLVKKKKYEKAKGSIKFYNRTKNNLEKQLKEVKYFIETHEGQSFCDILRDVNTPGIRKALFLIVILFALPHISGYINILSYMGVIIEKGKSKLINSEQFVIYANIMSVLSTLLTFRLIDKLGRRILLMISSIGTSTAMIGLGIHFLLLKNGVDADNLQWLPVICILGYLIFYAIGYSPVPSTVLSELFTDNVKSVAALIAVLFGSLCSFVTSKIYLLLFDTVGETYVFWMHAVLGCVSIPYALFLLPETKGKTFQQIQDSLLKI